MAHTANSASPQRFPPAARLVFIHFVILLPGAFPAMESLSFPEPPDTRPQGCEAYVSDPGGKDFKDLSASIVIPYRNEKWEHIKGSMASILHYTPMDLINEILFVSDGNAPEKLYINELQAISPKVSFLVLPPPGQGLIAAKMRAVGAISLRSNVIIFLEPHIRVNSQWLEPLLRRIREHPRVLAMPVLDLIPQDNFDGYLQGTPGHWRFEWNLNLIYTNPTKADEFSPAPMPTPATSGGIFAIRKDWWLKLRFYDYGMKGWGGDHVEATMKVWRCGGRIEVIPCSRIGHLFRDPEARPYDVQVGQVVRNYARLVETWFDNYTEYFYKMKPDAKQMNIGNVSKMVKLRESLHCKDMQWYLENVDREMLWEKDHICIPGCSREREAVCCEGPAKSGHTTIDKVIPQEEYRPISLSENIHLEL